MVGWASGTEVFEPVADALIATGASAETKQAVCSALIGALLHRGWDTGEESLGFYRDHDPIVTAFREHGIYLRCYTEHDEQDWVCEEREGHEGDHRDCSGRTWPQ